MSLYWVILVLYLFILACIGLYWFILVYICLYWFIGQPIQTIIQTNSGVNLTFHDNVYKESAVPKNNTASAVRKGETLTYQPTTYDIPPTT